MAFTQDDRGLHRPVASRLREVEHPPGGVRVSEVARPPDPRVFVRVRGVLFSLECCFTVESRRECLLLRGANDASPAVGGDIGVVPGAAVSVSGFVYVRGACKQNTTSV